MVNTFSVQEEPEISELFAALERTKNSIENFESILLRLRIHNAALKEQNKMLQEQLDRYEQSQVRFSS